MRVDIKTGGKPIRDKDFKAIYLIREAMRISTPRMKKANAQFALYRDLDGVDYLRSK